MNNNEESKLNITADTEKAKISLKELDDMVENTQRKIDRVFKNVQDNNGYISNKQLAGVQNGFSRLNDYQDTFDNLLNNAKANQSGSELESTLKDLNPKLDLVASALRSLSSGSNTRKLDGIYSARTTSSRAFRNDNDTLAGDNTKFGSYNADISSISRESRSNIHNISNTLKRELGNLSTARETGYVSYNRYQEYKASASSAQKRIKEAQKMFGVEGSIGAFRKNRESTIRQAQEANKVASSSGSTPEQVRYARSLDEQVKVLDKLNEAFKKQEAELDQSQRNLDKFNKQLGNQDGLTVGDDPNSFKGALKQRGYSIARGAFSAGLTSFTGAISQGDSLRLSSFDNIKSTAYANGGRDNKTLNRLGDYGYRYGYNGAQMGQFANAYTSSTGNVGSIDNVGNVAQTWARQSRVTGANDQSTLQLERTAGNSADLNSSQMSSVGNTITNSIINSGMSAKASEQQQGLAMLYQNASPYGLTANDEKELAGYQGAIAKGGAQFQGTQGAQTTMQLSQGLGNYNSPMMRQLFAQSNPGRYMGVEGSANMVFDMQNLQKQPWKMSSMLKNAEHSFGSKRVAAANLSQATGIPAETIEKYMKMADDGTLSKKNIDKMAKTSKNSKQGGKADKNYNNTGASQVQKYNSALADSAMKASQALDNLRGILAKVYKSGGGASSILSGIGGVAGNVMTQVGGDFIYDKLFGKHGGHIGKSIFRKIFKGRKPSVEKETEKATKDGLHVTRGIGSHLGKLRDVVGNAVSKSHGILGHGASFMRGAGRLGKKAISKIPFLDAGFALSDLKSGHPLDAISEFSGIGSLLSGSKFLHGVEGSWKDAFRGRFSKAGYESAKAWHNVPLIGRFFKPENTKYGRKIERMKRSSLSSARRQASKLNKVEKDSKGKGLLTKLGRHKKGIIGAGIGLAGLGLLDYFGNRANASSKKNGEKSEAWKILRGYNKMLDHAMRVVQSAKSIKNGGDSSSDDDSDISGTGGKGDKAIRSIAKAVAKKDNLDAKLVYAQLAMESADGTSQEAVKDNNFAGIKGSGGGTATDDGGTYQHFNSTDEFASRYAEILKNDGLHSGMSVDDWANQLHSKGYFTDSPSDYANQMRSWVNKYAIGGIRHYASGSPFITDHPTTNNGTDVFAEAGTEAYIPLNAGHYFSGISTLKDLAGLFGKQVVDPSAVSGGSKTTTINPSYNINLTINGGTDDPDNLAQTVANKVREMLDQYDNQQQMSNQQSFFANETSGLFV